MIRLFCGFDPREEPGLHVFIGSVLRHTSHPISIIPLSSQGLAQGSNQFTLSRFLVARLCEFSGHAIFCDGSDMLALTDIANLDRLFDNRYAVQVVKHPDYISLHERKYVGTDMESGQSNYARKNWASVMVVNCEHPAWQRLPNFPYQTQALTALQFKFLEDQEIGELPPEWNVLVDESQNAEKANLLHWTAGIPHFSYYADAPHSKSWFKARDAALHERRNV